MYGFILIYYYVKCVWSKNIQYNTRLKTYKLLIQGIQLRPLGGVQVSDN